MGDPEPGARNTPAREELPPEPAAPSVADVVAVFVVCGLTLGVCASALLSHPDRQTALALGGFSLLVLVLAAGRAAQYRHDVGAHAVAKRAWEANVRRVRAAHATVTPTPIDCPLHHREPDADEALNQPPMLHGQCPSGSAR